MTRWLRLVLRLALGGIFVYAAYTKLRQPWLLFAMTVDAYGLLPSWASMLVARTLPWFELLLGLALISGLFLRWAAAAVAGTLTAFFTLLVRSYFKGLTIDCGCFGAGEPLSAYTLTRDGLMLSAAIVLCVLAFRDRRRLKAAVAR